MSSNKRIRTAPRIVMAVPKKLRVTITIDGVCEVPGKPLFAEVQAQVDNLTVPVSAFVEMVDAPIPSNEPAASVEMDGVDDPIPSNEPAGETVSGTPEIPRETPLEQKVLEVPSHPANAATRVPHQDAMALVEQIIKETFE